MFSNLLTHFGNRIAVFGRRVIVEVDLKLRHHFVVAETGQVIRLIGKFTAIAVFQVDVRRSRGVAVAAM